MKLQISGDFARAGARTILWGGDEVLDYNY